MWQNPFPSSAAAMSQHYLPTMRGPVTIRSFLPQDQAAVERLYADGLLQGEMDPGDLGLDIDHIEEAYFARPEDHFWVAVIQNQVVGMIGVMRDDNGVAEIRRLRVEPACQNVTVAAQLIEEAIQHCECHGYLKIVLEIGSDSETAMRLLNKHGYQFTRSRVFHGRDTLEFYANIYQAGESSPPQGALAARPIRPTPPGDKDGRHGHQSRLG